MEYAIPLVLVLLVITVAIVLFVMRTASTKGPEGAADSGSTGLGTGDGEQTPFDGDDGSPLGDTEQHAGNQEQGETVSDFDAGRHGGAGRRGESYASSGAVGDDADDPHRAAHVARPGEAEGATRI